MTSPSHNPFDDTVNAAADALAEKRRIESEKAKLAAEIKKEHAVKASERLRNEVAPIIELAIESLQKRGISADIQEEKKINGLLASFVFSIMSSDFNEIIFSINPNHEKPYVSYSFSRTDRLIPLKEPLADTVTQLVNDLIKRAIK